MGEKLIGSRRSRTPAKKGERDTTSYEQPWGNSKNGVENRPLTRMPHERDESASATGNRLDQNPVPSDEQISRAVDDLDSGRVDTDRRGTPDDIPTPRRSRKRSQ